SEFRVAGSAESAASGETLADRRRPDLLLIDYRLPDRAAIELTRDLPRRGVMEPVLPITANAERRLDARALPAGAPGAVRKRARDRSAWAATGATRHGALAMRRAGAGSASSRRLPPNHPRPSSPLRS